MSASTTSTSPVGHLGVSLESKVVLPGDERFDDARRAWNLAIDQRPAAVTLLAARPYLRPRKLSPPPRV